MVVTWMMQARATATLLKKELTQVGRGNEVLSATCATVWPNVTLPVDALSGRTLHRVVLLARMIRVSVALVSVRVKAIADANHTVALTHG